jgi:hypothetical protein
VTDQTEVPAADAPAEDKPTHAIVLNGEVVALTVWHGEPREFEPPGSTAYPLPLVPTVEVGWSCDANGLFKPPQPDAQPISDPVPPSVQ